MIVRRKPCSLFYELLKLEGVRIDIKYMICRVDKQNTHPLQFSNMKNKYLATIIITKINLRCPRNIFPAIPQQSESYNDLPLRAHPLLPLPLTCSKILYNLSFWVSEAMKFNLLPFFLPLYLLHDLSLLI
uniref:Uncharacterized protein n=1 Tax=Cacopsylla melanoneura TaxID=428564 RepID=A0A8D8ZNS0_9HEMI